VESLERGADDRIVGFGGFENVLQNNGVGSGGAISIPWDGNANVMWGGGFEFSLERTLIYVG
jgi:hypothetical protein